MGFFSRNREAIDAPGADSVAFDARRPSRSERTRSSTTTRFDGSEPLDPADTTRRRARHRLIGAVALALAAVVFVPMLFNATPVAPPDDIALQIPDRDTPFEGRRGVPEPGKGPLKPSSEAPILASPPPVVATSPEPAPAPAPQAKVAEPSSSINLPVVTRPSTESVAKAEKPTEKPTEKPAEKPVEKAAEPAPDRPKTPEPAAPTDDPRALAALEGKSANPTAPPAAAPAIKAPTTEASGKSYAVQVAAYASSDTARAERDRLVANGLRAYTESVSTAQGLRIRVRLGPFTSRDAADRAKAKLKTMKVDGSVVPL